MGRLGVQALMSTPTELLVGLRAFAKSLRDSERVEGTVTTRELEAVLSTLDAAEAREKKLREALKRIARAHTTAEHLQKIADEALAGSVAVPAGEERNG